jgi:hypothetical protein
VIEESDLFVCFLGSSVGEAPRIGIWRAGVHTNPIELRSLTPGTRRMLAAMSLPVELESRRRLSRRDEEEIFVALARPFQTSASLLDARGVNATARSRGHQSVEDELRRHSLDAADYFAMATTGEYSAPRVKADVIEVVRAVHDGRWDAARHILAVASSPLWRDTPPSAIDVGALQVQPEMVTDPTARTMIRKAVDDAAHHSPAPRPSDEPDSRSASVSRPAEAEPHPADAPGHADVHAAAAESQDHDEPPSPNGYARFLAGRPAFGLVILVAVVAVAFLLVGDGRHGNDSAPTVDVGGPREVLRVYNRVTNGPSGMRDDSSPVQLTRHPRPFCKAAICIQGTARTTGQIYEYAICETIGDLPAMTNGSLSTDKAGRADNHNRGLYSSRSYCGVRLKNGIAGYVSDVWITPAQRAGKLSLPRCPANFGDG